MNDFKAPPPPPGFGTPVQPTPAAPQTVSQPQQQATAGVQPMVQQPVQAPVSSQASPQAPQQTQTPAQPAVQSAQPAQVMPENPDVFSVQMPQEVENKADEGPVSFSKKTLIALGGVFVLGLLMGSVFFAGGGKSSAPQQKCAGLTQIVANPDIKKQLKKCGQTEKSDQCVLYLMNNYTYEKLGEDFFELAASLTGRQEYVIRLDNSAHANMMIPPGYFAQIKIPPLR